VVLPQLYKKTVGLEYLDFICSSYTDLLQAVLNKLMQVQVIRTVVNHQQLLVPACTLSLPPLAGGYCPSITPPVHINIYLATLQFSCMGFVGWVFGGMERGFT